MRLTVSGMVSVGRSNDTDTGRLGVRPVSRQSLHRHTGTPAHRHTGTPAHRHTGTPAHRHTGTPAHLTQVPRARGRAVLSRAVCAAALLAFAALAAALLPDRPAEAQTSIWSGTLTPDRTRNTRGAVYVGCDNQDSRLTNCSSAVSGGTFDINGALAGGTRSITRLYAKRSLLDGKTYLTVKLNWPIPSWTPKTYTLEIGYGGRRYQFDLRNPRAGDPRLYSDLLTAAYNGQTVRLRVLNDDKPPPPPAPWAVPGEWGPLPEGVAGGQQFRLLFVTSTTRMANSSNIADYNTHVQSAANNNAALRPIKDRFRALVSTSAVDARDNTATTGAGVPIYWLGGDKVADDYRDFYDGSWDSRNAKYENGGSAVNRLVATGSNRDGTKSSRPAGSSGVQFGTTSTGGEINGGWLLSSENEHLYALSPVLTAPLGPTGLEAMVGGGQVTLTWDNPGGGYDYRWEYQQRTGTGAWSAWRAVMKQCDCPVFRGARVRHTVRGLDNGTTYGFRVRGSHDRAQPSAAVSATPAPRAAVVRLTPGASPDALTVEWTPPPGFVTAYAVQYKSGAQGWDSDRTLVHFREAVRTAITGLEAGTRYTVRVLWTNTSPPSYTPLRDPHAFQVLGEAAGTPGVAPAVVLDDGGSVSVGPGWRYIPDGVIEGRSFRLLFVTSTGRDARSSDIADYNGFVQARAAANAHLSDFSGEFRALASTASVHARDNTATRRGADVPVYWLGGEKVADDYADLYDSSWDSGNAKTDTGGSASGAVWTGTHHSGDASTNTPLGSNDPQATAWNLDAGGGLSSTTPDATQSKPLYALSPVITVTFDPDKPRVVLVPGAPSIAEGGSGNATTLKATLPRAVSTATTVTLAASPAGTVAFGSPTLTIPANATESPPVTVTAVNDDIDAPEDAVVTLSGTTAAGAAANPPISVALTVTDDDVKGITASPTEVSVDEGGTATFTVRLDSEPTADVVIQVDGLADKVRSSSGRLTFTPQNWSTPQTMTVTGKEDDDYDDERVRWTVEVAEVLSAGSGYESVSGVELVVTVTDNEVAPPPPPPPSDAQSVAPGWRYIPKDGSNNPLFAAGQSFRLLFVTSTKRDATSSDIGVYNTHVQNAANRNATLRPFKGEFRALISTATVDARDNTGTTGNGFPIYWLGGEKVADHYGDFYDGRWDSQKAKTETGGGVSILTFPHTGSLSDGTKESTSYAGASSVRHGETRRHGNEISFVDKTATRDGPLYALSPVITVKAGGQRGGRGEPGVVGPPESGPLTARVASAPAEHRGRGRFRVQIAFSEAVARTAKSAEGTIQVTGGTLSRARRSGGADRWVLDIKPDSFEAVTVTLPATADCTARGAVCTADGHKLETPLTHTVPGPAVLRVADARAREGTDASIDFQVTLSRAASGAVTVGWRTRNGSAKAGEDFEAASGTLTFAAGETAKTISVVVLDDAKDEGEETFRVRLRNAEGAVIADGEATGTIENDDPMPRAWLARFGRTVATQAVDAVTERLDGGAQSHATLGGQRFELGRTDEAALAQSVAGLARALGAAEDSGAAAPPTSTQGMTGRELLLGSAFHLASQGDGGGPAFAAWGRVAHGRFDADVNDVTMDGEVTTGFLGADVAGARWLAGAMVSVSEGEGAFTLGGDMASNRERGEVESALTSLYPYARVRLSERVTAWGLAGWGTGELTLTEEGGAPLETDLSMTMGALGAHGTLVPAPEGGGLALALKGDALWVTTESDAVRSDDGNLAASEADATRLRLTLDASRAFAAGGATLTPSLEVGLRHDGGDAETGTGVEVGAGLRYAGAGVTVEGSMRWLAAHEATGYEEWGASGSVRIDPGASGRGLSLTLAPTVGNASSGTATLWSAEDARGLAPGTEFEAARRLDAEVGYGLLGPLRLGTVTPYAGLGLADGGSRAWRAGARWSVAPEVTLGLEGTRSESAADPAEHAVMLRGALRW